MPNQAPIAVLSVTGVSIVTSPVVVSTVGTTDGDGEITAFTLNWGDGSAATTGLGAPLHEYSHTYASAGTYTITLSVADNHFATDAASATVAFALPPAEDPPAEEEEPLPPLAALTYVSGRYRAEPYVLSTVGTVPQETATLASGSLNWGDGTTETWSGDPETTYSHTYANAATYSVTLTVTDSNGAIATATRQVVIESVVVPNQAPVARLSRLAGNFVGDTYAFSTLGTADPDGTIASWSFTAGDGQSQSGTGDPPSTIHVTYTAAASRTATLTVTDNLGETDAETLAVTIATAPTPGSHTYFDTLVARSDRVFAYSLRDATQVANLRAGGGTAISYIYSTDPDARKQDAAKVVVPSTVNSISVGSQLYLPITWPRSNGSIMFTWDSWMGAEFAYATSGIPTYKHFQHGSPDQSIWCEVRAHFNNPVEGAVLRVGGRVYLSSGSAIGPNVTDNEPLAPSSASIAVPAETWTRYWSMFEPEGDWDLFTLWVAVAGGTPTKKYDRLQLKMRADASGVRRLGIFRLEYNTSTWEIAPARTALVAYVRNFVGLSGITTSTIAPLLEAP